MSENKKEHDVFQEEALVETGAVCYVFVSRRRFVISSTDESKVMAHVIAEFNKLKADGWVKDNVSVKRNSKQTWLSKGSAKWCIELLTVPYEK